MEKIDSNENKNRDIDIIDIKEQSVNKKRERKSASEDQAINWINEHFEKYDDKKIHLGKVYDYYLDHCIKINCTCLEYKNFLAIVQRLFVNGYHLKKSSLLSAIIKERLIPLKSKKKIINPLPKNKDILTKVFQDLNNPIIGIRFTPILRFLRSTNSSHKLSKNPATLLKALEHGVRFGYIQRIKGIGKSGYYRLISVDENKQQSDDISDNNANHEIKDIKIDIDINNDAEKTNNKKKKKRFIKLRIPQRNVIHSQPKNIEDTFYLAMVFNCEPKQASARKIKNYLDKYYNIQLKDDKLKSTLEQGLKIGLWSTVNQGSVFQGKLVLNLPSVDPNDDGDLLGKIVNAIMASNEPKFSSGQLLKQYVEEFFPKFNVRNKPDKFKTAIEVAENGGIIRRISGIGMTGSFTLVNSFIPSPLQLRGKDKKRNNDPSNYFTDSDTDSYSIIDNEDDKDYCVNKSDADSDIIIDNGIFNGGAVYFDKYKPRPSKTRSKAIINNIAFNTKKFDVKHIPSKRNRLPVMTKKQKRKEIHKLKNTVKKRKKLNKAKNVFRGLKIDPEFDHSRVLKIILEKIDSGSIRIKRNKKIC